jgi:hypothetical protein
MTSAVFNKNGKKVMIKITFGNAANKFRHIAATTQ